MILTPYEIKILVDLSEEKKSAQSAYRTTLNVLKSKRLIRNVLSPKGYKWEMTDKGTYYIKTKKIYEEITRGNNVIAKFMGGSLEGKRWSGLYKDNAPEGFLKYNKNWEWLMPVVEKIESKTNRAGIKYRMQLQTIEKKDYSGHEYVCTFMINQHPQVTIVCDSKIEAVWKSVTDFIKIL